MENAMHVGQHKHISGLSASQAAGACRAFGLSLGVMNGLPVHQCGRRAAPRIMFPVPGGCNSKDDPMRSPEYLERSSGTRERSRSMLQQFLHLLPSSCRRLQVSHGHPGRPGAATCSKTPAPAAVSPRPATAAASSCRQPHPRSSHTLGASSGCCTCSAGMRQQQRLPWVANPDLRLGWSHGMLYTCSRHRRAPGCDAAPCHTSALGVDSKPSLSPASIARPPAHLLYMLNV